MTSPEPWTNEPDPAKPKYRRIYDANGVSVARVYDPADADLIKMAPELREFARQIRAGDFYYHSAQAEAMRLYRLAGGK